MKKIYFLLLTVLFAASATAQGVANYGVVRNTGIAFTSISGTGTSFAASWRNGVNTDDNLSAATNIGFTFTYLGTPYTQFSISTNGYLTFNTGTVAVGNGTGAYGYQNTQFSAASGTVSTLAVFYDDQQTSGNLGTQGDLDASYKYQLSGAAGNRVLTVEWINVQDFSSTSTSSFNYQVKLYEVDNHIEFNYGTMTLNNSATITTMSYSLGINAATISAVPTAAELLTQQTVNTATFSNTPSDALGGNVPGNMPAANSQIVYTLLPVCTTPAAQPTSLILTPTATSIAGSFTAAAGSPYGYLVVRTPTNVPPSAPVNGTTYTVGGAALGGTIIASGTATSFNSTGLTPLTTYYYWAYSFNGITCSGGPLYRATTPLTASQSTTACAGIAAGTYTVGPTGTYPSLTAVTAALAGGTAGPVIFELQSTYLSSVETFPITFAAAGACPISSVIVRPQTGAVGLSITSANATTTIDINGANYLTIDGRPGGVGVTSQLTISNTALATAVAVRFINDASGNTITYCSLTGSTATTFGVVSFTTGTVTGNDNNTISNNTITAAGANNPLNGIYSVGTSAAIDNSGNIVSGNLISDYFSAGSVTNGINIGTGNSTWTISNNKLFQTATRTYTTANTHNGINIASGAGYTITGNTIGYASSTATGTTNIVGNTVALAGFPGSYTVSGTANATRYIAINATFTAGGAVSNIQNNIIAGFALYTSSGAATTNGIFCGIAVNSGNVNVGTTIGNTIGATSGTGSIYTCTTTSGGIIAGIHVNSNNAVAIQNNTMGAFDAMGTTATIAGGINGINLTGAPTAYDISGNIIGNTTNPNLRMGNLTTGANLSNVGTTFGLATGTSTFNGINSAATTAGTIGTAALPNIIRNTYQNSSAAGTAIRGISATGIPLISYNNINNLTSQTTNATLASTLLGGMGIFLGSISSNGAVVRNNVINTISLANATVNGTNLTGIAIYAGTTDLYANKIYDLSNASTSVSTTLPGTVSAFFMRQPAGVISIYNNMVSLGNGQTTNTAFNGIWQQNSVVVYTLNAYFNSINIEGAGATGAQPSFGLNRGSYSATQVTTTVDIRDNIFTNTRSGGTGKHYAIGNNYAAAATATGWGTNASNYNVLNAAAATVGYWGADQTFASWKVASASDANSLSAVTINYVNSATGDLHISGSPTPIEGTGIAIASVPVDFDNQTRASFSPTDIGADADNFFNYPIITYTPLTTTCTLGARTLVANIVDVDGVPTAGAGLPVLYWKVNAGAYTPATAVSLGGGNYQFTFGGTAVVGDVVSYYIVAQDNLGNVGAYPSAGAGGFTINPPAAATPPTTPSSYGVALTLSGTYTVGAGGNFTTLTAAVNAYNTGCLGGAVIFSLTDATYLSETYPITINQNPFASAVNTLTIKPAAGVTAALTGSANSPLIRDFGNYVTIDGSNNGSTSRNLTITNTSVTTPGVYLIGSTGTTPVTNSTIKNCILINGVTTSSCLIVSDGATPGNAGYFNNITIQNNSIQKAYIGLYCNAVVAAGNGSGLVITANDVNTAGANQVRLVGLYVQGANGVTMSQNNVANLEATSAETKYGIFLATGSGNVTVSGNTVSNINFTGASNAPIGILDAGGLAASGNIITGNTVTNITTLGGATVYGIECTSGGTIIEKNNVNNIKNNNTGTFGVYGIDVAAGNNVTIRNNFVSDITHDMSGGAAFSTTFGVFGIRIATGTGHKVYHNSVNLFGLMPGTAATSLLSASFALVSTASTGCDVRNNIFANNITGGSTSIAAVSVYLPSGGTAGMGLIWNNNAYYYGTDAARQGVGQAGATAGTNFYTTLAALTAYTSTLGTATNDNRSSANTTAPPFVSNSDLHIVPASANCNINNAGVPVGVLDDIDANVRSLVTPDIGADEFTSLSEPTITLGSNPAVCTGVTSANLTYSGTTNTPNQYSIDFNAAAEAQGFVDVTNVALPASPIVITVPGAAAAGTYNATITVRNTVTGCVGSPVAFSVTINPNNTITLTSAPATTSQTVCLNSPITNITYSTTGATGATFSGLPAGVTGNWAANVVTISGSPSASGTFNYTVTLTGGCGVITATGSITVNPTPDVTQPGNQSVCNNTATAPVIFTGSVPGTTFTWTNNTPSIGLAASGTGDIPSFTATNATAAPVTATITVTPVTGFTSSTFSYTGAMQTFTVPAGVTSITIDAFGAQGSVGNVNTGGAGGTGGKGSKASGALAVTPGQVLNIFVGGAGTQPAGGYNGGGNGGAANAGGGGGASDVRYPGITAADRKITGAGGGGGGTAGCNTAAVGGNGGDGAGNGSNGQDAATPGGFAGGGFGAIGATFGAKGIGCAGFSGADGSTATNENGATGGAGQSCCCPSQPGGGGGGGGQIGGGGGGGGSAGTTGCSGNDKGGGGGGAGGSNYVGGVTSTSTTNGVQTGNGMVVITYAIPPVCTGTPKTFTITVKPTPVAVATPASQTVCSGTPITTIVNTSTTSGTTFAWTRDNNVNVTGIAASGSGDISGTLTSSTGVVEVVTFTITPTANGCAGAPITATVTVNPLPSWTAAIVEPSTCVTADGSITLTMSGAGPYTFAWTGVGVNPTSQNQTNLTVGIYNVTVTETATGCQSSASYTLLGPGGCFVCPGIPNMTANPSPACTGATVTVQTTGMTNMGITYGITFKYSAGAPLGNPYVGGTTIATIPNAGLTGGGTTATTTTSFATAGTYYIYAILSPTPVDPSCRPSNVVVLTVNSTPTLTLGTSPTVCSGSITASLPFTSTYTGPNGNILVNGGFETGGTAPWVVGSAVPAPTISGTVSHSGTYSWALGKYGAAGDAAGDASGYQTVTIPAEGGTLSYWYLPTSADALTDDWQDAYITNTSGGILATVMHVANNSGAWTNVTFNMAAYAGQTVRVMFLVHNDGDGAVTNMYLDDVVINGPGGAPATYSITWSASAPAQGFANVTNAPLPSNPTPITLVVPAGAAPGTYTGTITVTNSGGCSTTPQTFTVTINPIPVVNQPANQVVCNGGSTAAVNFTTPTTGPGTIVYTWSHTASGIGLANNGTGNIPSFTAINNTNAPVVATITVIPSYTYNGVTCVGQPKQFTITINPTPTVNAVTNQTVCHNTATAAVNFTGFVPGTVYSWTNNNTTIGLAASGTGNIASFTATNATAAPVTATITVTPSYTNAAVTCTGTPITFTITVNPIPTVNAVANQTLCNGSNTTAVTFSGATAGTVFNWTNNNTTIGLAAAGTGNIPAFTAVNTTALPVTATITVTPSYTNNGTTCTGTSTSFTITVNPSPTVNPVPANQLLCNGSATTAVSFNGPVSGAFYTWTNNNTTIGLASVGASNIPSFIATNTGTAPVVATVTVTGSYTNGGVTCTGPSITFTYTVNPTPSVTAIANQTVCNNTATAAVTITGPVPGTVFNWTNNNTSIGLAANGSGNIGSFNAINNTASPVTATITVTPVFTANGLSCSGTPVTFTITVNPRPTVNAVANQVLCAGSATAAVTFTGNVLATTFSWTNSNTAIGLGASGTGNIPSFTATNTGNTPISGTITVTTNANACGGGSTTFTYTVNPTATVNAVTNITTCHGSTVAAVTFGSNVAGSVFNWTNNTPSIGLGASGIGNLPSFVAYNPTTSPIVATISVTATMSANGIFCTGPVRTFTITVNPGANIILTNAPIRVCLTDTVVLLTATPVGGVWSGVGVSGNTFNAATAGLGVKVLSYTVNNSFGCSGTALVSVTVHDCLERHNVLKGALRIYPNPTTGQFNIRFLTDVYKEFSMNVLDAKGAVLKNYKFTGLVYGSIIPIDLRSLPSGYYTLEAYNTQERAAYQLIIAH